VLKISSACALVCALFVAPGLAAAKPIEARATLRSDTRGPVIPRQIYGQFSEHLGSGIYGGVWVGEQSNIPNTRGIRNDVVAALKAIKVPVIRWPGGCFADEYIWRDGIGPRDKRPVRKNNWWGGSPETNQFGTHEFFDFAEQIGAEAYLAVNVGSSTPTVMREWIEYLTSPGQDDLAKERRANGRDQPFKVPYIGIGNESWGCGGYMTPEYYANEYRRFQEFFHKGKDNPAARVVSGAADFDTHWTDVVMKSIGNKRMDAISLHYYTIPTGVWERKGPAIRFSRQDWYDTMYRTLRMEEVIQKHSSVMDKHDPDQKIALFVDEWGSWYDVEKGTDPGHLYQLNTLRDGVLAAANFNIFHKYTDRVKMANIAQTVNVLQAMILTDGPKLALTPTYYAYKMYVPFQDATYVPLDVDVPTITSGGRSIPAFNISAAVGMDGRTYVGIAHLNPDDGLRLTIDLGSFEAKKVSGEVMTAEEMDALNPIGGPQTVRPVEYKGAKISRGALVLDIPAKSIVVVSVE
jgi:alpha-N-arabinofuranosidase